MTRVCFLRACTGRKRVGGGETWEVLCKGGQNVRAGTHVHFAPGLPATWRTAPSEGRGILEFFPHAEFASLLERFGEVPLPPYIKRTSGTHLEDRERYQTVYARHPGAIAAPTAGLHFTPELFESLRQRGIETAFLTLHIGAGTFQPVRVEQVEAHTMEEEEYELSAAVVERIHAAKKSGGKIIAVGTTTTRALESACDENGTLQAGRGRTALFMYPGFRFQIIDGLITNFHLPRSTLLMLVAAFAGRELTLKAYAEAVAQQYRFYSYGDAMLIV
jgi:S-adenosylmethionine:tRNA ribosyltransferase-isomerase